MGWVFFVVAGALVADLVVRALAVRVILPVFERKPPFSVESSEPAPDALRISFPTSHGLTLRGSLSIPDDPPRGLVVFCPEMTGSHWSAQWYCRGLSEAGFAVLSFDFRNQGESDALPGYDPLHWVTEYEVTDVLAALAWVRDCPDLADLPLGLFGVSRGGGSALAAAARCPEVDAVACEGAFTTESLSLLYTYRWAELYLPGWLMRFIPRWHLTSTLALARRVSQWRRGCRYTVLERDLPRIRDRSVLFIAGERDTYVPPVIAEAMCHYIGGRRQQVWVVPEARHNSGRRVDPTSFDQRLVAFFRDALPPGPSVVAEPARTDVVEDPVA